MHKKLGLILFALGLAGLAVTFGPIDVVNDLLLLPVSLVLLVVGILVVVVDRTRGGSRQDASGSDTPSLMRTIGITLVLGVATVYLIISTLVVLIAGGWDMPASRQLWLGLMVLAYFVGGVVVLARSLVRLRRGSGTAYAIPLVIPILSVVLVVAAKLLRPSVG